MMDTVSGESWSHIILSLTRAIQTKMATVEVLVKMKMAVAWSLQIGLVGFVFPFNKGFCIN